MSFSYTSGNFSLLSGRENLSNEPTLLLFHENRAGDWKTLLARLDEEETFLLSLVLKWLHELQLEVCSASLTIASAPRDVNYCIHSPVVFLLHSHGIEKYCNLSSRKKGRRGRKKFSEQRPESAGGDLHFMFKVR